jgi:hypothetical protein
VSLSIGEPAVSTTVFGVRILLLCDKEVSLSLENEVTIANDSRPIK